MNLQQHPDFYAFLFEMWCARRRSKMIRNELEICVEKVVSARRGQSKPSYSSARYETHLTHQEANLSRSGQS
jgi:hypothetical protein